MYSDYLVFMFLLPLGNRFPFVFGHLKGGTKIYLFLAVFWATSGLSDDVEHELSGPGRDSDAIFVSVVQGARERLVDCVVVDHKVFFLI